MGKLLGGIKNFFREKRDEAAEKLADPVRDGKFAIEDSKAELAKLKTSIAQFSGTIKKQERKGKEVKDEVKKWGNLATKAAATGNKEDVVKCVENKQQADTQLKTIQSELKMNRASLDKIKSQYQKYQNKVAKAESNHTQLKTRQQNANIRKAFASGSEGFESKSAFAQLDALEESVVTSECEAEALEEMEPVDEMENMEEKYNNNVDVDDEVAKLMAAAKSSE